MERKIMDGDSKRLNSPAKRNNEEKLICLELDDDYDDLTSNEVTRLKWPLDKSKDVGPPEFSVRNTRLYAASQKKSPKSRDLDENRRRNEVMVALMKELMNETDFRMNSPEKRLETPRTLYTVQEVSESNTDISNDEHYSSPSGKLDSNQTSPERGLSLVSFGSRRSRKGDRKHEIQKLNRNRNTLKGKKDIYLSPNLFNMYSQREETSSDSESEGKQIWNNKGHGSGTKDFESEVKQIQSSRGHSSESKDSVSLFTSVEDTDFPSLSSPSPTMSRRKEMIMRAVEALSTKQNQQVQEKENVREISNLARMRRRALLYNAKTTTPISPSFTTPREQSNDSSQHTTASSSLLDLQEVEDENAVQTYVQTLNLNTQSPQKEKQDLSNVSDPIFVKTPQSNRSRQSVKSIGRKQQKSNSHCNKPRSSGKEKRDSGGKEQQNEQKISPSYQRKPLFILPPTNPNSVCEIDPSDEIVNEIENDLGEFKLYFPPDMINTPRIATGIRTNIHYSRRHKRQTCKKQSNLQEDKDATSQEKSVSDTIDNTGVTASPSQINRQLSNRSNVSGDKSTQLRWSEKGQYIQPSTFFDVFVAKSEVKSKEKENESSTLSSDTETEAKSFNVSPNKKISHNPAETRNESYASSKSPSVEEIIASSKSNKSPLPSEHRKRKEHIVPNKWFCDEQQTKENIPWAEAKNQVVTLYTACTETPLLSPKAPLSYSPSKLSPQPPIYLEFPEILDQENIMQSLKSKQFNYNFTDDFAQTEDGSAIRQEIETKMLTHGGLNIQTTNTTGTSNRINDSDTFVINTDNSEHTHHERRKIKKTARRNGGRRIPLPIQDRDRGEGSGDSAASLPETDEADNHPCLTCCPFVPRFLFSSR